MFCTICALACYVDGIFAIHAAVGVADGLAFSAFAASQTASVLHLRHQRAWLTPTCEPRLPGWVGCETTTSQKLLALKLKWRFEIGNRK